MRGGVEPPHLNKNPPKSSDFDGFFFVMAKLKINIGVCHGCLIAFLKAQLMI